MNKNNLPEATTQDTESTITTMCVAGLLFTSYDVTKKLRHAGFHAAHQDVKMVTKDSSVFTSNYITSKVRVNGKTVRLFHPDSTDASDYDPNAIPEFKVDRGSNTPNVQATSMPNSSTCASNSTHSHNYSFDRHGHRYLVRAEFARQAGFSAGATVCVSIENGKIVLNKRDGRSIKVDRYSNIRIPKSDFKKAFTNLPSTIKVEVKTDAIEIKEN